MTEIEKRELAVERYVCEVADKTYQLRWVKLKLKEAEAKLKKEKAK